MNDLKFPCTKPCPLCETDGQSRPKQRNPVQNEDMMKILRSLTVAFCLGIAGLAVTAMPAQAELTIRFTDGEIEPMPYAVPTFIDEGGSGDFAQNISRVVASDLSGTGLFREVTSDAYISTITSFDAPVAYTDWQAINSQALITGAVQVSGDQIVVKFRVFDVFSGEQLGDGLQFVGTTGTWRRMAHKVADAVYSRITGEGGYFDSRVVYVAEKRAQKRAPKAVGGDGL